MKYKKGQEGPIALVLLMVIFLVMWFIWLGPFVADVGRRAVIDNNLSGVEAFFYNNINVFIILAIIMAIIGWGYLTSE